MEITLDQLLTSKEQRSKRQLELIAQYPASTLVCLTVIMPGNVKRNFHSLIVAQAAMTAMVNAFSSSIVNLEARDLVTGYEAYLTTSITQREAKQLACEIEDEHPLGRLFDIDVITPTGEPIARTSIGCEPRKCLMCDNEARFCMRNHTHTQEELHQCIARLIEDYVQ